MAASAFLYGIPWSGKDHPLHCEDTKADHEEAHVEKTEAPDNSQHQLASLVSESPWKWILQPQTSLQMMLPEDYQRWCFRLLEIVSAILLLLSDLKHYQRHNELQKTSRGI